MGKVRFIFSYFIRFYVVLIYITAFAVYLKSVLVFDCSVLPFKCGANGSRKKKLLLFAQGPREQMEPK